MVDEVTCGNPTAIIEGADPTGGSRRLRRHAAACWPDAHDRGRDPVRGG